MIKSMTAYGRTEINQPWGHLVCELRAVNHRYLEIYVRLPEELRSLEMPVREKIGKKIKRGKIECNVRYKLTEATETLDIDETVVSALIASSAKISTIAGAPKPLTTSDILNWPGVVSQREHDFMPIKNSAIKMLDDALNDFIITRQHEGTATEKMLLDRCDTITDIIGKQRQNGPDTARRLREKLQQKLAELNAEPDQQRLEQELVFAVQKLDIEEELDRLEAHVAEVRNVLKRGDPVGRRLDFLMQELNREANTLGAKSQDIATTGHSVELKVLIEQMREQVQNIE